ncbi:hypothetical protein FDENT_10946 [Fusarium denticulatum]|uniref:2EXR domain-containing protein n=1 Tax=Fusarium denticulatum TaxID=48507 RepID=A0A8H5THM7_9HYPO|nr:hypothetical protein FDENT_10946 [Fusarium denticulatum]
MTTSLGIGTQDALSSSGDEEVQILNPAILRSPCSFPKSNKLPPEVRDKIYIHSLAHERILKIYSAECRVELRERVALSKLFVTTLESRAAAKKFYCVHIPCKIPMGAVANIGGNPAVEKIHLRVSWSNPPRAIASSPFVPVKPHVPAFQTMEQDPRAVGNFLDGVDRGEMMRVRGYVTDWFDHLEEWGIENDPAVLYQIMMSYPDCDPEIIVEENACRAHDLSDQLSGSSTPNSQLSGSSTLNTILKKSVQAVYHRGDAIALTENEMEERKRILDQLLDDESEVENEEVEKLSRQDVTPAFGFWLFPLDALPVVKCTANPEVRIGEFYTEIQEQFEKHTPQLCLSHLPDYNPEVLDTHERTEKDLVIELDTKKAITNTKMANTW